MKKRKKITWVFIVLLINAASLLIAQSEYKFQQNDSLFADQFFYSDKLEVYIRTALLQNPHVYNAFYIWQSELAKISIAYGLPDPKINFGYFLENIETAVGPQEWKIGFMQMIPWPGKLKVQGNIQSFKAEAAHERLRNAVSDLIYQVVSVYFDAYYLEQSILITQENLTLVKQWEEVILTKYRTALAKHPDLIKTQIEAIKLEDDLATLKSKRQPILEQFRALLNEDTLSIIPPESLDISDIELDKNRFRNIVVQNNPKLASQKSTHRAAEKAVSRAKLNWLPDFSVGLDYMSTGNRYMGGQPVPESGKNPLVVMGSISLPLWGYKQAGQVRSARQVEQQTKAVITNTINRLESQFEGAWFAYEDARRKWRLYKYKLLPKSLESLKATEKAYIGNELEFLSLIDAQRRHLRFTLAAENAKINFYKSIAQLQKLAGRTI